MCCGHDQRYVSSTRLGLSFFVCAFGPLPGGPAAGATIEHEDGQFLYARLLLPGYFTFSDMPSNSAPSNYRPLFFRNSIGRITKRDAINGKSKIALVV